MEASLHAYFSRLRLAVQHAGASLEEREVIGLRQTAGIRWLGLMQSPRGLSSVVGCWWWVRGWRGSGRALF